MSNSNDNTKPKSIFAFIGGTISMGAETVYTYTDTGLRVVKLGNKGVRGTVDFVEEDIAPFFTNIRKSVRDLRIDTEIEQRRYLTEKYNLAEGEDFLKLSDEELIKRRIANQEKEEKATPTSSEDQKK